jgi:hypothetical protein
VVNFTLNVHFRVIPRAQKLAALPQRNHFFKILLAKNAYLHGIPHFSSLKTAIMARFQRIANIRRNEVEKMT